jgi:hypothetical protein
MISKLKIKIISIRGFKEKGREKRKSFKMSAAKTSGGEGILYKPQEGNFLEI